LKVAFVTPELHSLVRLTGLAEVSEALPRALRQAGADVRVFLPWTRDLQDRALQDLHTVGEVRVKDGQSRTSATILTGHIGDLPVVLVDHPQLLRTKSVYSDQEGPHQDNWRRFTVFCRAVLESFPLLSFEPDVVHCLDWTTGILPVVKELEYTQKGLDHPAGRAGTYFSVHSTARQGTFERDVLPKMGLPASVFQHARGVELGGKVSFLKAGAEFATLVGTFSPAMSERLLRQASGDRLEDTFKRRAADKDLFGVLNGIDYKAWDPSNDPLLPQMYSVKDKDLDGKRKCKASLQSSLKLDNGPRRMVAAVVGRFDADSGFDILAEVLTAILERGVQVVLLGTGRSEIIERVKTMESTFVGCCRLIEGFNANALHPLLGAADAMILPSHFNASNSLCAIGMRYGVVPVAYANSGLEDTIVDCDGSNRAPTGFLFKGYSGDSLLDGLDAARKAYKDAEEWKALALRCMKQDFSWTATAEKYLEIYKKASQRGKKGAKKSAAEG
jgi:starch synthase